MFYSLLSLHSLKTAFAWFWLKEELRYSECNIQHQHFQCQTRPLSNLQAQVKLKTQSSATRSINKKNTLYVFQESACWYNRRWLTSQVLHPHLSGGSDLLLPVLLHMELGGTAHTGHTGHSGVAGFTHKVSLLPGWQDLCRGRYLQEERMIMVVKISF